MPAESPIVEIASLIAEHGGADLRECMQCGSCTAVCPWPPLRPTSPRLVIRLASLGLAGYEARDVWDCVGCGSCLEVCPRGVDLTAVMRAARALLLEAGSGPRSFGPPLGSLRAAGNPWSGERALRERWVEARALPTFDGTQELLFFPCCTQIYEPHGRRAGDALLALLRLAGVSLGMPSSSVVCCGEQAESVGATSLAAELRAVSAPLLDARGSSRVLVASPHCLHALRRDRPADAHASFVHHAVLLVELVASGRLRPRRPVAGPVTYHDPCYLGRRGGEYEAPRRVLAAIPGMDLREMAHSRETSLCCGGGGGGIFAEVPAAERFATLRVAEARATGARVIATACPYCAVMFDDAVKVLDLEGEIVVRDVAELCAESLEVGP
jgi:Fe-S oxidoreductase